MAAAFWEESFLLEDSTVSYGLRAKNLLRLNHVVVWWTHWKMHGMTKARRSRWIGKNMTKKHQHKRAVYEQLQMSVGSEIL
jgi:hypothetical protein